SATNVKFVNLETCLSYHSCGFCCKAYGSEYGRITLATSNAEFLATRCMRLI
ncbi:hypothetical protein PSTT_13234, partial [Puccinia striiformis]